MIKSRILSTFIMLLCSQFLILRIVGMASSDEEEEIFFDAPSKFIPPPLFIDLDGKQDSILESNRMLQNPPDHLFRHTKNRIQKKNETKNLLSFSDYAGDIPEEILMLVDSIKNPDEYTKIGARKPNALLLYGPSGCGKTLIARIIASESKAVFKHVSAAHIRSKGFGESAKNINAIFEESEKNCMPSILFFDEIDSIAAQRTEDSVADNNVVDALLVAMDGFEQRKRTIVIGATNTPQILDKAIKRRFHKQIEIKLPDEQGRLAVTQLYLHKIHHQYKHDVEKTNYLLQKIVKSTDNYSPADIETCIQNAACLAAFKREEAVPEEFIIQEIEQLKSQVNPTEMPEDIRRAIYT